MFRANIKKYLFKYLINNLAKLPLLVILLFINACQWQKSNSAAVDILCATTSKYQTIPKKLSQSCLYINFSLKIISPKLIKFTPNYQLWSDGSNKSRWIYLPENSKIDTSNPDRWKFPVGTQIFKEFRQLPSGLKQEIIVETRHLQKIKTGFGIKSWKLSTYLWNSQQTEAYLSLGVKNVLNTDHDIPVQQDCIDCHKGNIDIVLGFDAIQLSDKQGLYSFGHGPKRNIKEWTLQSLLSKKRLSHYIAMPTLPGNEIEQKALGYLHANCGNCHNELGHAAEQEAEHLKLRHELSFTELEKTDVYLTAVNQKTKNFTAVPYIVLGAKDEELALYQSALFLRMNSTDEDYRMPMLATEKVDYQAMHLMHQWLQSIKTPEDVFFKKDQHKQQSLPKLTTPAEISLPLSGTGLQIEVEFFQSQFIPPVMAIYWPEDQSLQSSPVMDHKDGYFTSKLILGNKGNIMSLRNSDEVGHTIYVKDKKQKIRWQLSYMPPNSSFEQELFWDNDIFVEMKCRLHLYMSSWVGSISSKYNKIVKIPSQKHKTRFSMQDYPENFTLLNILLPKFGVLKTTINIGED